MKIILLLLIFCSTLIAQVIPFTTTYKETKLGAKPSCNFIINSQHELDSFYTFVGTSGPRFNFDSTTMLATVNQQTEQACDQTISSIFIENNLINVIINVNSRYITNDIIPQPGFLYHLITLPKQLIMFRFINSYQLYTIEKKEKNINNSNINILYDAIGRENNIRGFNILFTKQRRIYGWSIRCNR